MGPTILLSLDYFVTHNNYCNFYINYVVLVGCYEQANFNFFHLCSLQLLLWGQPGPPLGVNWGPYVLSDTLTNKNLQATLALEHFMTVVLSVRGKLDSKWKGAVRFLAEVCCVGYHGQPRCFLCFPAWSLLSNQWSSSNGEGGKPSTEAGSALLGQGVACFGPMIS